jgi:hypothetical protein
MDSTRKRWLKSAPNVLRFEAGKAAKKRGENFNSRILNALPQRGDSTGGEMENLQLTEQRQGLT